MNLATVDDQHRRALAPCAQLARPVQAGTDVNHRDELYQIETIVDLTVCAGRTDLPSDSAAGGVSEAASGDANA